MTRVLSVVGSLNRGGAETWMIQALYRLKGTGIQVDFLVHGDGPFHYQAEAEALKARVIVCRNLCLPPLYVLNLISILKKFGPYDVIHSHMHYFSGIPLLAAAIAGVPLRIVQSHLDTQQIDAAAGIRRRMYTGLMKRLIWSCATAGTAVCAGAADALFPPQWRTQKRWKVMLLGIDPRPFEVPVDAASLRQELDIPAGVKVVGHVGRFETQKNHKFLLRVAAAHLKSAPDTVFLLVGDGPLRKSIEAEASALGIKAQVRFSGVRGDVPALMREVMDVLIMPSLLEGLPLALLEAQAAGLPCLLSDNIAEETDRAPLLMNRHSLTSSAASWAARLQTVLERQAGQRRFGNPELVGIDRSVKDLIECYSSSNVH